MKVGDLVTLSAYGRSLKTYYIGRDNDVALIVRTPRTSYGTYRIRWVSDGKIELFISRQDIKYAKITTGS